MGPTRPLHYGPAARSSPGVQGSGPSGVVPNPGGDILRRLTRGRAQTTDRGVVDVGALRRMLIAHGYRIPAHGDGLGKLMKSALADFLNPKHLDPNGPLAAALHGTHITGDRNAQDWNKRFAPVGPGGRSQVTLSPSKTLDSQGNNRPGDRNQRGPAQSPSTVNLSSITRMAEAAGVPIPESLAKQLASNAAGEQFDPQIHDIQTLLAQEPVDAAQHVKNIGDWYGQVQGALGKASARDTAATKAGVGSVSGAVQAIISSLGGHANRGAGDIGAMGANDVGTLQALGTSQDMLNNDLAPIIAGERASQLKDQSNKDALAKAQLQQQLQDFQGQRGQALGAQQAQTLLQILQQNNQTAQQNFQNRLAVQQAGEAAQLNGLKAMYYASKSGAGGGGRGSIGYATPSEMNDVMSAISSALLDPSTGALKSGITPSKAKLIATQIGGSYFPNGGVPNGWAANAVAPFFQ